VPSKPINEDHPSVVWRAVETGILSRLNLYNYRLESSVAACNAEVRRPQGRHPFCETPSRWPQLIERICTAHPRRNPASPLVKVVDGAWAYCAGNAWAGHVWKDIAPTRVEYVGRETPPTSQSSSFISRWRAGLRGRWLDRNRE
jgi:hypothetical protein